jgi:hypothetical protein
MWLLILLTMYIKQFKLPGMSLPPQLQSGSKQTSLRHFAAVLSGVGCGYNGSGRDGGNR